MAPDTAQVKRIRGVIVEVLYARHQAQRSRVDHVLLWGIMRDLGCDVGENDVLTQLQDMSDRGYVRYDEKRDRRSNRMNLSAIQLTSKGRDLCEQTIHDPAVSL